MKPTKTYWLAALVAAIMMVGAGTAAAFHGKDGEQGFGKHCMAEEPAKAVYQLNDLTDAQRQQLEALFDDYRGKMRAQCETRRNDRRALREAMQEGADLETLRPLAEKQGQHVTETILARADLRNKVGAILTEDQREELKNRYRDAHQGCRRPGHDHG